MAIQKTIYNSCFEPPLTISKSHVYITQRSRDALSAKLQRLKVKKTKWKTQNNKRSVICFLTGHVSCGMWIRTMAIQKTIYSSCFEPPLTISKSHVLFKRVRTLCLNYSV